MTSAFCSIALGAKLGSPKRGFYIDHAVRFHEKVLVFVERLCFTDEEAQQITPLAALFQLAGCALRLLPLPAC